MEVALCYALIPYYLTRGYSIISTPGFCLHGIELKIVL